MPRLFLSYRRADAQADARHLHQALRDRLPHFQIVRDLDDIPPGADFANYIAGAIADCDVVLVLIGPSWRALLPGGGSRLDSPADIVRMEVAAALQHDKLTVPVLLYGTPMPDAAQLPAELRRLSALHAVSLQDRTWDSDVAQLAQWLRRLVPVRHAESATAAPPAAAQAPTNAAANERPAVRQPVAQAGRARRRGAARPAWRGWWVAPTALLVGVPVLLYLLLLLINAVDEAPSPLAASAPTAPAVLAATWQSFEEDATQAASAARTSSSSGCTDLSRWSCLNTGKAGGGALLPRDGALMRSYLALRADPTALAPVQPRGSYEQALSTAHLLPYFQVSSHALAWLAVDLQGGRAQAAWLGLADEVQFHRRLVASAGDSFARTLAMRRLQASLRFVDDALGLQLPRAEAQAAVLVALRPMDAAETDLQRVLLHDLDVDLLSVVAARDALSTPNPAFTDLFRSMAAVMGSAEPVPRLVPFESDFLNLAARPLFQTEATANHFKAMHRLHLTLVALAPPQYAQLDPLQVHAREVGKLQARLVGLPALYNPAGKSYIQALRVRNQLSGDALPGTEQVYTDTHDTDAYIRLLAMKLRLKTAGAAPGSVPGRIQAEPTARGPYDGLPLRHDEARNSLNTTMLGRLRSLVPEVPLEGRLP